jgi:hypothetical protein
MRQEAIDAIKAAPPAGYLVGTVAGLSWSEWASIAALVYTCWLLGEKVWKAVGPRVKKWLAKRGL